MFMQIIEKNYLFFSLTSIFLEMKIDTLLIFDRREKHRKIIKYV